jgi:hypothetical protein
VNFAGSGVARKGYRAAAEINSRIDARTADAQ